MSLHVRRSLFIVKQIMLYFVIAIVSGFFVWAAPVGIARYGGPADLSRSTEYRAAPALIVAGITFFVGVLSFLISYALFIAKNPKAEMDSQMMFDIQLGYLTSLSAWSKRHIIKIIAAVILFAFLIVLADAFLN